MIVCIASHPNNYRGDLRAGKIYIIRGLKVMLDKDLAVMYNVEVKRLNEVVR